MNNTYLYIKRFIDKEIHRLNEPLRPDRDFKEAVKRVESNGYEVSDRQVRQALGHINTLIKRHGRNVFAKQVVNQIVQQVVKVEEYKLQAVNKKLLQLEQIVSPVLIPDFDRIGSARSRIAALGQIVDELPEERYLFFKSESEEAEQKDEKDKPENDDSADDSDEEQNTIQETLIMSDDELVPDTASIKQLTRHMERQVEQEIYLGDHEQTIRNYGQVRQDLIAIHKELQYKCAKLDYLSELRNKLVQNLGVAKIAQPRRETQSGTSDEPVDSDEEFDMEQWAIQPEPVADPNTSNIAAEINKFKILVEKIALKLGSQNLSRAHRSANAQLYNDIHLSDAKDF
ncbi:Piso0_001667 [Millerozyma farinosa CBS 7064]|uniref:Piso0_001667 protein n=1 Tax=Pichia sorbitophila (strain ATCC MYA-4447 / BCRC 22081 / CBS 7064 / NBRC 10061 / NRRL Y-12695) TaxID=559304 RepID=G8YNS2_PICSO|nr:Piso0_001667 [Millerozyma farinosa CBS 7064]